MKQKNSFPFSRWLFILWLFIGIGLSSAAERVKIDGLYYELNGSNATVTYENTASNNYANLSGVVEIPEKVSFSRSEYTVTGIGNSAFNNAKGITSVIIPNSVSYIASKAFTNCSSLTSLTIPSSVTKIDSTFDSKEYLPFYGCTSLTTLRLEDGDQPLEIGAYYHNTPGWGAFSSSPLEELYLGRDITYPNHGKSFISYPHFYGYSAFYGCRETLKTVIIGERVTSLPQYLFYECDIINLIICFNITSPNAGVNTFPAARNEIAKVYVLKSGLSGYKSSLKWSDFTQIYPMIQQDNLLFIPIDDTSVAVTKYPNTSPESLSIPAIVSDEDGEYKVTAVYSSAFRACPDLTLVEFPSTLTDVRPYAFANNSKLASLTFNGQVKIGDYAFADCPSITSLTLPNTLEEIGDYAFLDNTSITSATFGTSVKTIGQSAFGGCSSLTAIKLPDTVESIGSSGFENCIKLTYASLGSSLTALGDKSFKNCKALSEITTPATTLNIGNSAFEDCSNLSLATLNNGLLTMGCNTFKGCESLLAITIPGSVTNIGSGSFDGCVMISTVNFQPGESSITIAHFPDSPIKTLRIGRNLKYTYGNGLSPFYNKKTLNRVLFSGNYVTNLYDFLFDGCSSITQITLPSNLETINTYVFKGCASLSNMTIPGSVKSIGSDSFDDCTGLKNLTFEDGEAYLTLGSKSGMFAFSPLETLYVGRNIKHSASKPELSPFFNRSELTDVRISDAGHVSSLCNYFLDGATSLSSVVIPESVTEIGKYGFANCVSIENIILPGNLEDINEGLFQGCSKLRSLSVPSSVQNVYSYALGGCKKLTELRFEDSPVTLTAGLASEGTGLCGETALEKLYIGRNIRYSSDSNAGYSPFYNLTSLNSVSFSSSAVVTECNDYLLSGCSSVENLSLPESLEKIGRHAFSNMTALQYCRMFDNVKSVGEYCFSNDENLSDLTFSTGVSTLKNNLFDGCLSLPTFTVHPAVTTIEDNVFSSCNSLSNLSFTDNSEILKMGRKYVKNSYSSLFADCPVENLYLSRWLIYEIGDESWSPFYSQTGLRNLTLGSTLGDIGKFLFEKCSALETVNIPGVESIGEKAFYQCSQLNDLTFNSGTRSLGEYSFAECVSLDNVNLPSTVTSISDGCFMNCTSLNTLDMGTSLEIIGPSAFSGCSNLVNADIPETVYGLGVESFKGCSSLPYINIPDGINSVGARAFQGCTGAEWVTLSSKVTSLGANSFDGCSAIRYIKSFNEIPPVGLPAFVNNVIENATVFVPANALDDYKDADIWWEFYNIRSMSDQNFVTYLTLDKSEASLQADETVQLSAIAGPDEATDTSVGFVSDNVDVVTVDNTGLVTAIAVGEANVKAYAKDGSGFYQICKITVLPTLMESLTLDNSSMTMRVNRRASLSTEVFPATTTNKEIIWSSSNRSIAEVDSEGNITTKYKGITTIKATATDGSGVMATCELTVLPPMAGDSNDNDAVTVTDAVNTANYAVGNDVENFCFEAADVNEDNRITLSDASATVSLILDEPVALAASKSKSFAGREVEVLDCLLVDDYIQQSGSAEIDIYLDNMTDYVALQADLILPEGMKLESISCGNRVIDHSLITKQIDSRTVRLVLFDPLNSAFSDNEESLLVLKIRIDDECSGGIVLKNILGSDKDAHEYMLYARGGNVNAGTGVSDIAKSSGWIETEGGNVRFFNYVGEEVAVYSTDGMIMSRFVVTTDGESHCFAPGVYVLTIDEDTHKVVVK